MMHWRTESGAPAAAALSAFSAFVTPGEFSSGGLANMASWNSMNESFAPSATHNAALDERVENLVPCAKRSRNDSGKYETTTPSVSMSSARSALFTSSKELQIGHM